MNNTMLATKIVDAIMLQAVKEYPLIEKMVPATKIADVKRKIFDQVFKELEIAQVKVGVDG